MNFYFVTLLQDDRDVPDHPCLILFPSYSLPYWAVHRQSCWYCFTSTASCSQRPMKIFMRSVPFVWDLLLESLCCWLSYCIKTLFSCLSLNVYLLNLYVSNYSDFITSIFALHGCRSFVTSTASCSQWPINIFMRSIQGVRDLLECSSSCLIFPYIIHSTNIAKISKVRLLHLGKHSWYYLYFVVSGWIYSLHDILIP